MRRSLSASGANEPGETRVDGACHSHHLAPPWMQTGPDDARRPPIGKHAYALDDGLERFVTKRRRQRVAERRLLRSSIHVPMNPDG
jgi:hypothetical protein